MSIPLETQNFRASSYTGPYPRFPFGGSSCHWPDFSLFWRSRSAGFSPCPQLKPRRLWSKGLALEKKRVAQGGPGCFACGMRAPLVNLLSLMSGPRGAVVGCVATDRAARQRWPCIKDDTWWWGMGWWFANLDTVAAGIWTGHSTGMGVVGALCLLPPHSEAGLPPIFIEVCGEGEGGKGGLASAPQKAWDWAGGDSEGNREGKQDAQQCQHGQWPQGILRTFSGSQAPEDHPCPGGRAVRAAGPDTPPLGSSWQLQRDEACWICHPQDWIPVLVLLFPETQNFSRWL